MAVTDYTGNASLEGVWATWSVEARWVLLDINGDTSWYNLDSNSDWDAMMMVAASVATSANTWVYVSIAQSKVRLIAQF